MASTFAILPVVIGLKGEGRSVGGQKSVQLVVNHLGETFVYVPFGRSVMLSTSYDYFCRKLEARRVHNITMFLGRHLT